MVAMRLRTPNPVTAFDNLIDKLGIEIVPVDREQALLAREAFRRFGKGRHKAGLNLGDCFAYALAKENSCRLLYVGADFAKTDVASVL